MNIYFLGTGSECNYQFPRRKNTSLLLEMDKENVIIDIGDAFADNWNLLKQRFPHLKFPSILMFSHPHIDHICSFAAFRHYAMEEKTTFRTYASEETMREILKVFHWLTIEDFQKVTYLNYGEGIKIASEIFTPFLLHHGKFNTTGFKFGQNTFLPDFNGDIPEISMPIIKGVKNIVMECNGLDRRRFNHNNLANAIKIGRTLNAESNLRKLILTHLSDDFPVEEIECRKIIKAKYPSESFEIHVSSDLEKITL